MGTVINIGSSLPTAAVVFDGSLLIEDDLDPTKILQFQASGISTGTTRTVTAQNASGTMYITGGTDVAVSDGGTGASTASGGATNLGLGTTDAVTHKSLDLYDTSSLGSECLSETDFATELKWTDTADFAIAGGNATYTHSSGTGTITQTSANLNTALVGDSWYRFQYDISGVTGTAPAVTITTGIAASAQSLVITNGTNKTIDFKTKSSPGNFVISVTSTVAGVFVLDNVSLKQITGGALTPGAPVGVAHGGTGATTAAITSFNNITGLSAAGTTGTTSTNLVFSTSPVLTTPTLGDAIATSVSF